MYVCVHAEVIAFQRLLLALYRALFGIMPHLKALGAPVQSTKISHLSLASRARVALKTSANFQQCLDLLDFIAATITDRSGMNREISNLSQVAPSSFWNKLYRVTTISDVKSARDHVLLLDNTLSSTAQYFKMLQAKIINTIIDNQPLPPHCICRRAVCLRFASKSFAWATYFYSIKIQHWFDVAGTELGSIKTLRLGDIVETLSCAYYSSHD